VEDFRLAISPGTSRLGLRIEEADARPSLHKKENALALGRYDLARSVALDIIQSGTQRGGLLVIVLAGYVLQELGEAPLAVRIWRERVPVFECGLAGIRNDRQQSAEQVYQTDIKQKWDKLYKKP